MPTITFSILLDHIEDNEGEGIVLQHYPWEGTDRNYLYEEVSFPSGKKEKKMLVFFFLPYPLIMTLLLKFELVQLLGRVFNILRENNPELAGDRRRTVMRPPQVLREGTKKTVFVNFMDLCKTYVDLFFPSSS